MIGVSSVSLHANVENQALMLISNIYVHSTHLSRMNHFFILCLIHPWDLLPKNFGIVISMNTGVFFHGLNKENRSSVTIISYGTEKNHLTFRET